MYNNKKIWGDYMLTFLLGLIGSIIALIGWFGFKSVILLIVGTLMYVIETILEWKDLNAGAKGLDVVIFVIGCVVALFGKIPFYVGGMVAVNCFSALMSLLGLPAYITEMRMFLKFFRR